MIHITFKMYFPHEMTFFFKLFDIIELIMY